MKQLTVDLGVRSYPIHIGAGVMLSPAIRDHLAGYASVVIITNTTVAPLYLSALETVMANAGYGSTTSSLMLPDGEQFKTGQTLEKIYDCLLRQHIERNSLLVALGGGVIGDMTGFAAATYQRGIDFIQVPTTLLAQVDSSVGGKTGINHPLGKNMIGAFHQPRMVVIDTNTLNTLPAREFSAGMAEVIKYGLIDDPAFLGWLEANMSRVMHREEDALCYIIEQSCAAKARIVSADERESGRRALLNLGHTFGHAIEAHLGYGEWLHGEAVAAGTMIATRLSELRGWLDPAEVHRVQALLRQADLPVHIPAGMQAEDFFHHMRHDKKVSQGRIRYVLLKQLGQAVVSMADEVMVAEAINLSRA